MIDTSDMPQYDGMDYEELVAHAQFLWLENKKLTKELRGMSIAHYMEMLRSDNVLDQIMAKKKLGELGIEPSHE